MTDALPTLDGAPMIIGGEDVAADSGEWLETRDPASGRVIGRVPRGTAADVHAAVRAARATQQAWGALASRERGARLLAIADRIAAAADELVRLETLDVGKPLHEAGVDVAHAERLFRFYGEIADKSPRRS
jgi:acyl-CoA reductase-like NAD-dependent aldehyde dehydrogenase